MSTTKTKISVDAFVEMLAQTLTETELIDINGVVFYIDPARLHINEDQNIMTVTLSNGDTFNIKVT